MEKVQDQAPRDEIAEAPTAARAAALWWAKQVGAPIFRNTGPSDSPQDRVMGDMAGLMMSMISDRHPVDESQGAKFVEALENVIAEKLTLDRWGVNLGVDYGPDRELAIAADAAGVSYSRFPWKTHMWVKSDHVTAALGYGAQSRLIWTAPDWVRPQCQQQNYDQTTWKALDQICTLPLYHEGDHGGFIPDPARCKRCGGTYSFHYSGPDYPDHSYDPAVSR